MFNYRLGDHKTEEKIVFNAQRKTRSKKLAQKIRTKKSRLRKNIIILSPKQRK